MLSLSEDAETILVTDKLLPPFAYREQGIRTE
jgi:hypothetical protein